MKEQTDCTLAISYFLSLFTNKALIIVYFLARGKNDLEIIFPSTKIQWEIYFNTVAFVQGGKKKTRSDTAAVA